MYLVSEMRGTMFIDCSSWKSSLHAYGIFREDMCPDDLQKWHLHIARESDYAESHSYWSSWTTYWKRPRNQML